MLPGAQHPGNSDDHAEGANRKHFFVNFLQRWHVIEEQPGRHGKESKQARDLQFLPDGETVDNLQEKKAELKMSGKKEGTPAAKIARCITWRMDKAKRQKTTKYSKPYRANNNLPSCHVHCMIIQQKGKQR